VGLAVDKSGAGLGLRCARYAMVVDNCEVKYLGVEPAGEVTVSSAAAALAAI
jgi:alkyl hydroperoxide reductase 1